MESPKKGTKKPTKQQAPARKSPLVQFEEEISKFWQDEHCFEESVKQRPADNRFSFYDGPPFATGLPHYGHIVASLMKDMVPRYWTMNGKRVDRVWGWDCHGLPIENLIEKEQGIKSKREIDAFGVDKFNDACRATVLRYVDEWKKVIPRTGRWVDMEHPYKTMDLPFMESVWWVFRQLWDRDLIYEGRKAMHICTRCVTPLSNFEVAQGYKDIHDLSVIALFPITDTTFLKNVCDGKPTSFIAWTTTPWSLPTTMGLAVGPDIDYVLVRIKGDQQVICAKSRLEFVTKHLEAGSFEIVRELKGSEMEHVSYEHAFDEYNNHPEVVGNDKVYKTHLTDYVSTEEGTGIVTINGAFGDIDMEAAQRIGLPIVVNVTMEGLYTKEMGEFAGQPVKPIEDTTQMDTKIAAFLEKNGSLFRREPLVHSYPHCWRCDTPLLNYATSSWFVKVTAIKDQLLQNNQQIDWIPEHIKEGRFGKWLEHARDWSISRNRYWGTPLPIWKSDDGDVLCIGSVEELQQLTGETVTDIHKQYVDRMVITKNGKEYRRIPEVLDTWFDSGSMPYAHVHYPFENKETFERSFPANFIAEGQDQTRGWFYVLHVLSAALTSGPKPAIAATGKSVPAFQHCIVNGIVLAEDGKKMSKRLKNYPDPVEVIDKYGADALRYYLATSPVMEAENLNFRESDVDEIYKKYSNTLWNVFTFYQMFAQKYDGEITEITDPNEPQHVLDQWVFARLHQVVAQVTAGYEGYRLRDASRPLLDFVQEVSTWYVRRSRDRFKGTNNDDRLMALRTLKTVLKTVSLIAAPVTPFLTEKIFREIRSTDEPISVHLCDWPESNSEFVKPNVLEQTTRLRTLIEQLFALRAAAGIKVRQPLQSATMTQPALAAPYEEILKAELNVKKIIVGDKPAIDTTMTDELRAEGMLRELVRQTNALRKKSKLTLNDTVEVRIQTASDLVTTMLKSHGDEYKHSVLAHDLSLVNEPQPEQLHIDGESLTVSLWTKPTKQKE